MHKMGLSLFFSHYSIIDFNIQTKHTINYFISVCICKLEKCNYIEITILFVVEKYIFIYSNHYEVVIVET